MADAGGRRRNYDWWQEFTSQAIGPRHDVHAGDHRLCRHARQPQQLLDAQARDRADRRARSRPTCWRGCSCPAASSIATRGSGRRARTASSPRAASSSGASCAWRRRRRSSTGSCSPTSTTGCSTTGTCELTRDLPSSARRSSGAPALYAVFGALLVAVNVRLRLREGPAGRRGSAQRARRAAAALGFIGRHPGAVRASTR